MNLHAIAASAVSAINPMMTVLFARSTGWTTSDDGTRVPTYSPQVATPAQAQPLSSDDLRMIDGLNLNGELQALYLNGGLDGVSRPDMKGGDIVTYPDGSVWLVAQVFENWSRTSGWAKVAVTRQNV